MEGKLFVLFDRCSKLGFGTCSGFHYLQIIFKWPGAEGSLNPLGLEGAQIKRGEDSATAQESQYETSYFSSERYLDPKVES